MLLWEDLCATTNLYERSDVADFIVCFCGVGGVVVQIFLRVRAGADDIDVYGSCVAIGLFTGAVHCAGNTPFLRTGAVPCAVATPLIHTAAVTHKINNNAIDK